MKPFEVKLASVITSQIGHALSNAAAIAIAQAFTLAVAEAVAEARAKDEHQPKDAAGLITFLMALENGHRVAAINEYRALTGADLTHSAASVDALLRGIMRNTTFHPAPPHW